MTHLLKLLDKMCKHEMDPASIVEDTEQTWFCPHTDRWTDGQTDQVKPVYPPFNLIEVGGMISLCNLWIILKMIYEPIILILWKFMLLSFCFFWSHHVTILHISWQLSCHAMCKIVTRSNHSFWWKNIIILQSLDYELIICLWKGFLVNIM